MHKEVQRQKITYYVSDDGKKRSQNRDEIEYYEKSLEAKALNQFEMVMKFKYYDFGWEDHSIYKVENEKQFQDLLASFGKLYDRHIFKPEEYSNLYKPLNMFKNITCFFDFIYTEGSGDAYDELEVKCLGNVIESIEADCDACYKKYEETKKLLGELNSLK